MLMKDNRKNAATVIVDGMRSQAAPQKDGAEQDPDPYLMAAEEVLNAIDMKDASALADAMRAMHDLCESQDYDEPEEA